MKSLNLMGEPFGSLFIIEEYLIEAAAFAVMFILFSVLLIVAISWTHR